MTDDNPRSEDPAAIRRAILAGAPGAIEIGDRRRAIETAIGELRPGDLLVIAGKGHETGQIVGNETLPFDDAEIAREIAEQRFDNHTAGTRVTPLWTAADAARATGGTGPLDWAATGVSIDTRSLSPGDLFMALRGPNHDAHEFVLAAFERGAVAAMVDREIAGRAAGLPLLRVGDTLAGLTALGAYRPSPQRCERLLP